MKHARHLEKESTIEDLLMKHAAERYSIYEDYRAGPNFFRGVAIALPVSLSLWSLVLYFVS